MDVAEMLRRFRIILDDAKEPYQISTDQLYLLLQNAYMDIQTRSSQWKFLHKRGKLFKTTLTKEDYNISGVRYINPDSAYAIQDGTTQRLPLLVKEYADWVVEQTANVTSQGSPLFLVSLPDFKWKIDPLPINIWTVYADYWVVPAEFVGQSDSPIWAEEFHDLVLLEAMRMGMALKPDKRTVAMMEAQVVTRLPKLWRMFVNLYLPTTRGAGAHL